MGIYIGISYMAVIVVFLLMLVAVNPNNADHPHVIGELHEGFAYTFR